MQTMPAPARRFNPRPAPRRSRRFVPDGGGLEARRLLNADVPSPTTGLPPAGDRAYDPPAPSVEPGSEAERKMIEDLGKDYPAPAPPPEKTWWDWAIDALNKIQEDVGRSNDLVPNGGPIS